MVVLFSAHREMSIMNQEEKKREIIKYCLAYKKSGRRNKCIKIIGRCLHQCEGTKQDAFFASTLLRMLSGDD